MSGTKALLLALTLVFLAENASAACTQKRSRDYTFVELAVPEGAPRPTGVEDFRFIDDSTTIDQLIAKVGPPDAAQGSRVNYFIYCFADGTELAVASRDRVSIDSVRHDGREIFKRNKKKK
jgi:hypothetical protein